MTDETEVCTYDPLVELMARFEGAVSEAKAEDEEAGSVEQRLQNHIVQGKKKGLEACLEEALQDYEPLAIVNEILLEGMKTVGELFGAGKLQLPFVLQSAQVMKQAVAYLEPRMEKVEGAEKGSILLATVAGDVHDIGKNLVDIILSNNGYRVVNIGIKQPIQTILKEASANQVDVIGMSGLLVKSTIVMRDNLIEMEGAGLGNVPVLLGGAALTRGYVEQDLRSVYGGPLYYAQDAFEGLELMGRLTSGEVATPVAEAPQRVSSHRVGIVDQDLYVFTGTKSEILPATPPLLPFYGARKETKFDIFEIYRYVNKIGLYRGQWQYRRPEGMSNPEFDVWLAENVDPVFDRKCRELAKVLRPAAVRGYFWAQSEGNDLVVFDEDQRTERHRFRFPRQSAGKRLCLADFFHPVGSGTMDVVGFQLVTMGSEVTRLERTQFECGDYQEYLFTHGMGVECAEALAEYWHRQVRQELGIADQEPETMKLLFSAKYHGSRYSFGYPACPNLEDQTALMELLDGGSIGVNLSEEFMLEPEQSTSAIIVHHPEAKYFNVG
ncbi:MAG: B12-binding domain-containing protein [Fimbriimonadaceae bacterium]|nr:B12-binding domain-containing protein [Fimbriimonadaceae bacterium]